MPQNKKEKIIFTIIMASLMVLGMTIYNLLLTDGGNGNIFHEIVIGYPMGLLVALLFDLLLVGPVVETVVFKLIIPRYKIEKVIIIGIVMSLLMVVGMVSCMSVFGVIVNGYNISHYPVTWLFNLIMAVPLQIIIVGPIARTALSYLQQGESA
ncbi:DUF2798 domain-containing protein [Leuconostoc citreum]|uniref:DUF2798 domain-containing protein n=1 Tax=Leuconostoc citreum TaxID=33964 RepID=UPI0032DF1A85